MLDNDNSNQSGPEISENPQECCPPTSGGQSCCSSDSGGLSQKWRVVIFFIVVAAAGAVLAHSLMRKSRTAGEPAIWGPEMNSLAALDEVAKDADAVFILICSQDQQNTEPIISEVEGATEKIRSRGNKVSAFRLKADTVEYENLAKQFSVPTVLAMVKGLGYSAVSGQITQAKLLEAFVKASRAPSACCPPGTDPALCNPSDFGQESSPSR